ncbi:MAG: hypothetical protein KAS72_04435 [Phycisphaerales bacterium]|nr:hypothetical protein [Phycisphaerales bacterium]
MHTTHDHAQPSDHPFVSRGGLKLDHALQAFDVDVAGLRCADFGCSVGGFTDCLLQRGAAHVVAIDTAYGILDYRLRTDPRVTVMERTNVLHVPPIEQPVDLVVIDMGWTTQRHCLPAALPWLTEDGRIITLVKPHYEAKGGPQERDLVKGILPDHAAESVLRRVLDALAGVGLTSLGVVTSPIRGGGKRHHGPGNVEYLTLLQRK